MHVINPHYLIHIANAILLVAFAVRDVLLLRSLFLAGSVIAIGYYYLQSPPLWDAIAWTALYCVIHTYWIVRILMERRPVVLTPDEETLHRLAFKSLTRRKFARLAGLGQWRDAQKGEELSKEGERVSELLALISGNIEARSGGQTLGHLGPGKAVGTASMLLHETHLCDFVVDTHCRYLAWPVAEVQQLLDRDPDLRAQILNLMSEELANKIRTMVHRPENQ
jgi:hypothetical protein